MATAHGHPSNGNSGNYASSYSDASDATGRASGYSFSSGAGAYAVHGHVWGTGDASSTASFTYRVENNSSFAQHYFISFHIYGGSISIVDL